MLNGNCDNMKSGAESRSGSTKLAASDLRFICTGHPARKGRGTERACGESRHGSFCPPRCTDGAGFTGKMFKSFDLPAF